MKDLVIQPDPYFFKMSYLDVKNLDLVQDFLFSPIFRWCKSQKASLFLIQELLQIYLIAFPQEDKLAMKSYQFYFIIFYTWI